jgi:hypothetical protein
MESERQIPSVLRARALLAKEGHTSILLQELVDSATGETFTIDWLISHLPKHSFGVIMLFLALISMLPIISIVAQLLISLLAIQIIAGYHNPVLPRKLAFYPLPSRYLVRLEHYAIPALQRLERTVRPRWHGILYFMRRPTAFIALILTIISLITPIPMANVPPAIISVLMALGYIEHDGLLLTIALFLALALLGTLGYMVL